MDNGVWENIQKYLPDNLSLLNGIDLFNYTKKYLTENIVDLFEIDIVEIYMLPVTKDVESTVVIPDESITTDNLINLGYKLNKDTKINKNDITTIVIDEHINYNYKIYPFIKMKLI